MLIFQILVSGVIFKLMGFGEVLGGLFAMRWSMIGIVGWFDRVPDGV